MNANPSRKSKVANPGIGRILTEVVGRGVEGRFTVSSFVEHTVHNPDPFHAPDLDV